MSSNFLLVSQAIQRLLYFIKRGSIRYRFTNRFGIANILVYLLNILSDRMTDRPPDWGPEDMKRERWHMKRREVSFRKVWMPFRQAGNRAHPRQPVDN